MQQGDEYALPIRIAGDKELIVSPTNCADVKVMIKDIGEKTYSSGELAAGEDEQGNFSGYWLYPLTQQETLALGPVVLIQAQVKFDDGAIVGTPTKAIKIGQSIIRTQWNSENDEV